MINTFNLNKNNNNVETPPNFIKWMEEHYEIKFDFDCCPLHSTIDTLDDNIEWGMYNYCNPPYSSRKSGIKQFIEKAIKEQKKGILCFAINKKIYCHAYSPYSSVCSSQPMYQHAQT